MSLYCQPNAVRHHQVLKQRNQFCCPTNDSPQCRNRTEIWGRRFSNFSTVSLKQYQPRPFITRGQWEQQFSRRPPGAVGGRQERQILLLPVESVGESRRRGRTASPPGMMRNRAPAPRRAAHPHSDGTYARPFRSASGNRQARNAARVGDQVFVHVSTELGTRLRKDIPVAEQPHHLNPIVR